MDGRAGFFEHKEVRYDTSLFLARPPHHSEMDPPACSHIHREVGRPADIMWTKRSISAALLMVASMSEAVFSFPMHAVYRSIRYNQSQSYVSERDEEEEDLPKKKGFFANFFQELDAFVDDATSRRLGNGAQYYGKRKSSFYGADDSNKKRDSVVFDPTEDYWAANGAGYFKWIPDEETGELKPVTRMKEKVIEKPKVR